MTFRLDKQCVFTRAAQSGPQTPLSERFVHAPVSDLYHLKTSRVRSESSLPPAMVGVHPHRGVFYIKVGPS